MIETAAVVNGTTTILESFGIIGGLFVILVVAIVYSLIKYIPMAFKAHFDAIKEMQDAHNETTLKMQNKFSSNLDEISTKYLQSIGRLGDDHAKQMEKMNDIHNDIKVLNGHINK